MMGRFVLVCLILTGILMVQAMADGSDGSERNPLNPPKVKFQARLLSHDEMVEVADRPASSRAESPEASSRAESPEGEERESGVAEAPEIRRLGKHRHSSDKSVAGGGVIIGGLVTAIFASVFCYIRVTRRRDGDHKLSGGN